MALLAESEEARTELMYGRVSQPEVPSQRWASRWAMRWDGTAGELGGLALAWVCAASDLAVFAALPRVACDSPRLVPGNPGLLSASPLGLGTSNGTTVKKGTSVP